MYHEENQINTIRYMSRMLFSIYMVVSDLQPYTEHTENNYQRLRNAIAKSIDLLPMFISNQPKPVQKNLLKFLTESSLQLEQLIQSNDFQQQRFILQTQINFCLNGLENIIRIYHPHIDNNHPSTPL